MAPPLDDVLKNEGNKRRAPKKKSFEERKRGESESATEAQLQAPEELGATATTHSG